MAEFGPSQRRATESTLTLVSQANTLLPNDASGTSYSENSAGVLLQNDATTVEVRLHEVGYTPIGVSSGVSNAKGTGYTNAPLGPFNPPDYTETPLRAKQAGLTLIGRSTPETSSHGTSYTSTPLGVQPPITGGGGGGPATTTYYKLRARDSACGSPTYVEWVTTSTPLSVASYGGILPCGGPLVDLTVLSIVTR